MVKKVLFNKNLINKKIKYKLIPITLATIMVSSSGCGFIPNGENAKYNDEHEVKNNELTSMQISTEPIRNECEISNLNEPLKNVATKTNYGNINYKGLDEFKSYLESLDTIYEYESLYDFDSTLKEYKKLKLGVHETVDEILDLNSLYNIVSKNSKIYKEQNDGTFLYKILSNRELKGVCSIIIKTVNDYIKSNKDIDKNKVYCILNDLKIYNKESSLNNAGVTDDNILVLSPTMLEFSEIYGGKGTSYDVIVHETMHLLQKGCNCDTKKNINLKNNFGISYSFNNLEVNSLNFSWLFEASAEKEMTNYTGHNIYVYKNKIGYLQSLSVVNVLNDNFNVNSTEKLSFKRDLNELFKYFNVSSEKDKREILNMMYSINVMQEIPDDFYSSYEKLTGIKKTTQVTEDMNYRLKSTICETLTKFFYRNLACNIENKNINLEDIFYLICIFESDINSHIDLKNQEKYIYNESFIDKYIEIQDNFFHSLSKNSNYKQEEIETMFYNYTSKYNDNGNNINNYNLNFIDSSKIDFLNKRVEEISNYICPLFREMKNEYNKSNVQKVYE